MDRPGPICWRVGRWLDRRWHRTRRPGGLPAGAALQAGRQLPSAAARQMSPGLDSTVWRCCSRSGSALTPIRAWRRGSRVNTRLQVRVLHRAPDCNCRSSDGPGTSARLGRRPHPWAVHSAPRPGVVIAASSLAGTPKPGRADPGPSRPRHRGAARMTCAGRCRFAVSSTTYVMFRRWMVQCTFTWSRYEQLAGVSVDRRWPGVRDSLGSRCV